MKEDLTKQLNALQETVPALRGRFNIEEKKKYLSELEIELASPDLWKNRGLAEQKNKEALDILSGKEIISNKISEKLGYRGIVNFYPFKKELDKPSVFVKHCYF